MIAARHGLAGGALLAAAACAPARAPLPVHPMGGETRLAAVQAMLDSAITSGAAPGAVLAVSLRGERWWHAAGRLGEDDATPPDLDTVYDLASLTKVVATTQLIAHAVETGRATLDDPVRRWVPAYDRPDRRDVTLRHLLTHTAGLPADRPLWRLTASRAEALLYADTVALAAPPGTAALYSDLGPIALGQVVEAIHGTTLDRAFQREIARPLGLRATRFRPPRAWRARIAPTERDPWRGRVLRGEVHDEKAAFLGGVAGHAGLFGSARELLAFGEWMLAGCRTGAVRCTFTRRADLVPGSSRALGWDTPSPGGSAGTRLSAHSFGHTGFTGTSLWIDPTRELVIVLLSNRVHPTRANVTWIPVRARVADAVVTALESSSLPLSAGTP